jgi:F-type H+-transporting ATPase subunit delta
MRINKEIRRTAKQLLRASLTDGQLDRGRVASLVQSLIDKKPRHYVDILENYKRLIRLEVEKRHARIESATPLNAEANSRILKNLQTKYGKDLTMEFVVNPELLGGMRIRIGSDVWDGSVRNRLERLKQQL